MTDRKMNHPRTRRWSALLVPVLLGACTVGPDYEKPEAAAPAEFKEAGQAWRQAAPSDAADRGPWWAIYNDPILDGLEKQVDVSNQTLRQSLAAYDQAKALVDEADASFWPTVAVSPSVTRSGSGSGSTGGSSLSSARGTSFGSSSRSVTQFGASASATWDIDLWGKIRRTVEADEETAQADAADVANARLSAQATLASDYFQMRGADQLKMLLHDTVEAFKRSLKITQDQYNAGTAAKTDVITAPDPAAIGPGTGDQMPVSSARRWSTRSPC
ncbi:MAG: TolC family protein [Aliidongia sp.]